MRTDPTDETVKQTILTIGAYTGAYIVDLLIYEALMSTRIRLLVKNRPRMNNVF